MAGKKYDQDKLQLDLIEPEILEELGKVLSYGALKYGRENWKSVESHRYQAALLRHYVEYRKGGRKDEESGLLHLSHMLANVAFLLWKSLQEVKDGQ